VLTKKSIYTCDAINSSFSSFHEFQI
jgi:hypothetical protein